jgi:hypothetical protein
MHRLGTVPSMKKAKILMAAVIHASQPTSKTPLGKNRSRVVNNDLAAIRRSPLSSGRSSWLKQRDHANL